MRPPTLAQVSRLLKSSEGLLSRLPRRDPEAMIVRSYVQSVDAATRLEERAKRNAKAGRRGTANRQASRAAGHRAKAAEFLPLVEKILAPDPQVTVVVGGLDDGL